MAANTSPIFPDSVNIGFAKLTTADTSYTVPTTGGEIVFTAGIDGARVDQIKVRALGTNVATVLRLFINDGGGLLAANFALVHEQALSASTASNSSETGLDYDINLTGDPAVKIPPIPHLDGGYKIYAAIGTAAAAGWMVSVIGGDY